MKTFSLSWSARDCIAGNENADSRFVKNSVTSTFSAFLSRQLHDIQITSSNDVQRLVVFSTVIYVTHEKKYDTERSVAHRRVGLRHSLLVSPLRKLGDD